MLSQYLFCTALDVGNTNIYIAGKTRETNNMELNEYQDRALDTCLQESRNTSYMLLNLVGEVGER